MRGAAVCLAALLAAVVPPASAEELKPKFGDIDGAFIVSISDEHERKECRRTVQRMVASCLSNTTFISNTLNRRYPDCLPIFRSQAAECAAHFRRQRSKCDGERDINIAGFTGFGCEVTATGVEEGDEPERGPGIAPMDRRVAARTRVNLRAGPGTDYRVVGALSAGQEVQATGRAGDWLRIALPDGAAFVHGDFMVAAAGSRDPAQQGGGPAAQLSPKCAGMGKGAKCWIEVSNRPGCHIFDSNYNPPETATWSGACAGGVAVGHGTWEWQTSRSSGESTGTLVRGRRDGRWVVRRASGFVGEGSFVDGKLHGRAILRYPSGQVEEGPYVDGKRHGRWVVREPDGDVGEGPFVDGKRHGRWVYRWANGTCSVLRFSRGKEKRPRSRC